MGIYIVQARGTDTTPPRRFNVNAPNEIWAMELAAVRAGYRDGYEGYLRARESPEGAPELRVMEVPTLNDRAA